MISRRSFLRGAATGAALIPVIHLTSNPAHAAELVPVDDPTAKALGYVEDAATATRPDKAGTPGDQQVCSNCALYLGEGETAPCTIFQGREVVGAGWCNAWVPKG